VIFSGSATAWRSRVDAPQEAGARPIPGAVGNEPSDQQNGFGTEGSMAQPTDQSDRPADEIARKQSLFREINERIDELIESADLQEELTIFCECGTDKCYGQITLIEAEYEQLRRVPTHFAVLPGHDLPAVERVISKNERYLVVEKFGEAGIAAIKLDPRRPA
jgi:hypothetical protein